MKIQKFENLSKCYDELKIKSLTPKIKNFKFDTKNFSVSKVVMYFTNKVMNNTNLSDSTKILFIRKMEEMLDYDSIFLHQLSFRVLISMKLDTVEEDLLLLHLNGY